MRYARRFHDRLVVFLTVFLWIKARDNSMRPSRDHRIIEYDVVICDTAMSTSWEDRSGFENFTNDTNFPGGLPGSSCVSVGTLRDWNK